MVAQYKVIDCCILDLFYQALLRLCTVDSHILLEVFLFNMSWMSIEFTKKSNISAEGENWPHSNSAS